MYSSQYKTHLIKGLTTNESLFFSVMIENQNSNNIIQTVYKNLLPYISRVSLNKIKKNLITKGFVSKDFTTLIDPVKLSEPIRKESVYTVLGRPSNQ